MLEVENLACAKGSIRLFSNLSFTLRPSELLYIRGPNGSGKTSLLRILAGFSRPEQGTVRWHGEDILEAREDYAASLVYLGHQPAVKDDLTVTENLEFSARIAGMPAFGRQEIVNALHAVGLDGRQRLLARFLSQGQRRRLALARLWLDRRSLWILDEPFTALDAQASALLERRLEQHLELGGMGVMTTHTPPSISEAFMRVMSLDS